MQSWELSKESIQKKTPAVFATTHDGRRSDRYVFVSTESLVDKFNSLGWGVRNVMSPKFRKTDPEHGKHMVTLRNRQAPGIKDPRMPAEVGMVFPEINILNSSNGTTRLEMRAGLFMFICSNGAVISKKSFAYLNQIHQSFKLDNLDELLTKFIDETDFFSNKVNAYADRQLNEEEKKDYAHAAGVLTWGNDQQVVNSTDLLTPRREEDNNDSLWAVYNRVQENIMKGGVSGVNRRTRAISNIDRYNDVNENLWNLNDFFLGINKEIV
jgi:hypothetical protein